jgi:hypothetical protein
MVGCGLVGVFCWKARRWFGKERVVWFVDSKLMIFWSVEV